MQGGTRSAKEYHHHLVQIMGGMPEEGVPRSFSTFFLGFSILERET